MPVQPILDLKSLDRTTVLHDKEAIYALLPHRGTFSLMDAVLHMDMKDNIIVGYRDVRDDEWWCQDHIPGNPIFPGAMMVEASAQLGTFHFYHCEPGQVGAFIGFTGIDKTRFRGTVAPGCRLYFIAKAHRMRSNLFTYIVQGVVERDGVIQDNIVFQTEVTGMVLVPAKEPA